MPSKTPAAEALDSLTEAADALGDVIAILTEPDLQLTQSEADKIRRALAGDVLHTAVLVQNQLDTLAQEGKIR